MPEANAPLTPPPLVLRRWFAAPPALVFSAWSSAEHLKQWFSPAGFTTPHAEVDFRPGGVCAVCMRAPDGQEFWSRGTYLEIVPHERLVSTSSMDVAGEVKFTAISTITFAAEAGGTQVVVQQDYTVFDPEFMAAVNGAPQGWRTTLDKLVVLLGTLTAAAPAEHATFTIERVFTAPPAQVFRAFTSPEAKAQWFAGGDGYTLLSREMDVRPGGREHLSGRWASGVVSTFDAVYFDVTPERRLVYAYDMHLDACRISVSLATLDFFADPAGTRLVLTEQGAFLNGYQDGGSRQHGTGFLLGRLAASLTA